jgi:hypothetical protein
MNKRDSIVSICVLIVTVSLLLVVGLLGYSAAHEILNTVPAKSDFDLNWRERKLPTSGRGVSEPLQLKCGARPRNVWSRIIQARKGQ